MFTIAGTATPHPPADTSQGSRRTIPKAPAGCPQMLNMENRPGLERLKSAPFVGVLAAQQQLVY